MRQPCGRNGARREGYCGWRRPSPRPPRKRRVCLGGEDVGRTACEVGDEAEGAEVMSVGACREGDGCREPDGGMCSNATSRGAYWCSMPGCEVGWKDIVLCKVCIPIDRRARS